MTPHRGPDPLPTALLLAVLLPALAFALPEDAAQNIVVDATSSEIFLDQGLFVYQGTADKPARITQGSLVISGLEVRLERADDGSLKKVTATGSPARLQQQPAADQDTVHASGQTLVFDKSAQMLTIDESAELSQGDVVLTSPHIDYNLETRQISGISSSPDDQVQMVIPATRNDN